MNKPLEDLLFGSAMADVVMADALHNGEDGIQKKMEDFVNLYMNFRCQNEVEALKTRYILIGFLTTLTPFLVAGSSKGGQNVH